jgi:hypothetical protein
MKAIVQDVYGQAEVLRLEYVEKPGRQRGRCAPSRPCCWRSSCQSSIEPTRWRRPPSRSLMSRLDTPEARSSSRLVSGSTM